MGNIEALDKDFVARIQSLAAKIVQVPIEAMPRDVKQYAQACAFSLMLHHCLNITFKEPIFKGTSREFEKYTNLKVKNYLVSAKNYNL